MTGESWIELLYAVRRERTLEYYCIDDPDYEDYERNGSKFFFNFFK